MRFPRRRFVLLVAFAVTVFCVVALPAATSKAEPGLTYHKRLSLLAADSASGSQAGSGSQAAVLAKQLSTATTDEARVEVLGRVFDALHIGIYSADGSAIVSGAEQSAQDFYFYEAEIQTLASSLGRGDRWSFDELAGFLNRSGEFSSEVTAPLLRDAVAKTITDAGAHEGEPAWLSPALVGELGFQHTPADDLATGVATSVASLDALQRTLIVSDMLIGLPHGSAQVARSNLVANSRGILREGQVVAAGACGDFKGTEAVRNIGKFAAGFVEIAGTAIQVVTLPLDAFHGATLALGVKVEALADNLKTHYGHEDPGTELQFPVRVRMLDQLTQTQIECGWMAGITFPKQGPIPNVKIEWDSGKLEAHGTVTCGVSCQQTGDDGVATLRFEPKQEQSPYTGRLTSETGRVEANALYLSSLGNIFGAVNEVVTPKTADFVWQVGWHAKGSWEGQVSTTWNVDGKVSSGTATVRFDLALASPGEGDEHTNVYQLAEGTDVWSQTLEDCVPSPKTGTTVLDPGSAALTVTEQDGMMTYEFAALSAKTVNYTVQCGDDATALPAIAMPPGFPYPMAGEDNPRFKSEPVPVGDTISGSTTLVVDGGSVTWTWKLTRK